MYDYIIYGAGPCGLTLALNLGKKNKVLLVEKENNIGGCWRVEWFQDKYFTEHSPRVINDLLFKKNYFFKFLKDIDYDYKKDLVYTYGNIYQTNKNIINFFIKHLLINDIKKLLLAKILKNTNKMTVTEWCNYNKISENGKKALGIFSILMANSPDKLLMSELTNIGGLNNFYQFTDNEKWLNIVKEKIDNNKNITIMVNSTLDKFNVENNKIISSVINNDIFIGKNHIMCLPPIAFYNVVKKSNITYNWPNIDKWINDSYYYSFGFQLHFKYKVNIIKEWCFLCHNDYNLIMLPTSNYAKKYSFDNDIKTVWSLTIVDTTKFINSVGKTVNEMTKDEIINDILNKLSEYILIDRNNIIVTIYDGVENVNGEWISKDSAFSLGKNGIISRKGVIENLYSIGSHNKKGITTINKAIKCGYDYLNENNYNYIYIWIIIVLLVVFLFYLFLL
jgi:hypothetical protein